MAKPSRAPANPRFGSGPCAKRPGWSVAALEGAFVGRSHRAPAGRAQLGAVIAESRAILRLPEDYRLAIVPGSDTGAMEIALWSLLGPRGVDVLAWESFGKAWAVDIAEQLRLDDLRCLEAPYGKLPDLVSVDPSRDVVFTWNGTTSGVCVPDANWLTLERAGLAICDATSAAFGMALDWRRLDAVTWSWQKMLGGEAAHGMLAMSPRAVARLETHIPPWPVPKLFRLTREGRINEALFAGETLNTPSMLAVADAIDGLKWAKAIGGLDALTGRVARNFAALSRWVEGADWIDFLADQPEYRSPTSVCLSIVAPEFRALDERERRAFVARLSRRLEAEGAAFDIASHRDAPPGLRIWCGATVETIDIEALCPWLDWAFAETVAET